MIVFAPLRSDPPQLRFPDGDHAIDACGDDRSRTAVGLRIRKGGPKGRPYYANPRVIHLLLHGPVPLPVALTDPAAAAGQRARTRGRDGAKARKSAR